MTSEGERSEPSKKSSGERSEPRDSGDDRRESSSKSSGEERSDDPRDSGDEQGEAERSDSPAPAIVRVDDPADGDARENGDTAMNGDAPTNGEGDGTGDSLDPFQADPGAGENGAGNGRDDADDIPLNIAGHDAEKRRREAEGGEDDGPPQEDDVLAGLDVTRPDDTDDDEVEPVELLVQLAKDGEIEPWDIDIVTVTDKFLDRLDDADLRAGGRALFYASVLLRMKSDAMLEDDEPDREDEAWDAPMDDPEGGPAVDPFAELEREMDRRLERKHARGTPQTLDELVRDLREAERDTLWKEHRTYDTSDSPHGYARGTQTLDYHSGDDLRMDDEPTQDEALGVTHDEHMEDIINDVYVALQNRYDKGRDEVLYEEIEDAGGSRVDTFLGLLFLAHRGQVRLQQDELFGDLWVQDPAAVADADGALAD